MMATPNTPQKITITVPADLLAYSSEVASWLGISRSQVIALVAGCPAETGAGRAGRGGVPAVLGRGNGLCGGVGTGRLGGAWR